MVDTNSHEIDESLVNVAIYFLGGFNPCLPGIVSCIVGATVQVGTPMTKARKERNSHDLWIRSQVI